MIVNSGKDSISVGLIDDMSDMAFGDDGSATTSDMTSLVNKLLKQSSNDKTGSDIGESLHRARLTTADLNGKVLREVGLYHNPTGTEKLFNRIVHAKIEKDNTFEIQYEISIKVQNG